MDSKDWLGDQQMSQVVKGYFNNPDFSASLDGSISLWNIYNLMKEANKNSYIDRFISRAKEIDNIEAHIAGRGVAPSTYFK